MRRETTTIPPSFMDYDTVATRADAGFVGRRPGMPTSFARLTPITARDVGVALTASAIWLAVFAAVSLTAPHTSTATAATATSDAGPVLREDRSGFQKADDAGATWRYWPCGDPACDQ